MLIIDTHCHTLPYWHEPVEILLTQMDRNRIEKALLVQFRGMFDNSYLIECARRHPGRFSSIVMVDTDRPDAPEHLKDWVKLGAEGVRLRPTLRSPGSDPLAIWRKAWELGIVVSAQGNLDEYTSSEFEEAITTFSDLKFVIEHLGRGGADKSPGLEHYRKVLELAKYPNTYMKVPGLGEICPRPIPFVQPMPFPEVPPLIEMALEAFGAKRLMWGSDYPPSSMREGYANTLKFPMEYVKFKSEEDKEWVFGKTADTLWKFR